MSDTIEKKTFCTICSAFCGFTARVAEGRVLDLVPDPDHPMSRGFSCSKGRQGHHLLTAPNRIVRARSRVGEAGLRDAPLDEVYDQVAATLRTVVAEHGPESVAVYAGNGSTFKTTSTPAARAWLRGLGSHQFFSSLSIDQPAKIIAVGRTGLWAGGTHDFETADVAMMIGNNVVVSSLNVPGAAPGWRPMAIREAKERGLKLIVVDPRRTQTANLADLHLQIRPGEDAALLAGMLKLILDRGLHDRDFCADFVDGVEALHEAVTAFDLDTVAMRTGLDAADITTAAEWFASGPRGTASSATGPDMGPHGNLVEHLIASLNIVCGRFNRAGEVDTNAAVLMPDLPPVAAVVPRDFMPATINPDANQRRTRLHGAHQVFGEMPTAVLADEILTPGVGQIRALVVIGGNPMTAWPDHDKTRRALESLDLLVCIEVRETDTVALADHVLPASYGLERCEITAYNDFLYNRPFVQFTEPVVEPPGDAREEWRHLAELARRLGTTMVIGGQELDVEDPPSPAGFFELLYPEGSTRVPFSEIARHAGGKVHDQFAAPVVQPKFEGMDDRFQVFPDGVAEEFQRLLDYRAGGQSADGEPLTHLLIPRRTGTVYNSMCHELPRTASGNPARLHPLDLQDAGVEDGDVVRLSSAHGSVQVHVAADSTLRRGVVSLSHGFGARSSGEDHPGFAMVSRLLSTDTTLDPVARMPLMSAVPVRIDRIASAGGH